ncbi:MAG TPA: hypothetical protein VF791_22590 [Pyrinomonadaceae bacterium]
MKRFFFLALMVLAACNVAAAQNYNLPELHTIKTVTLSPSYSCRSQEEFQTGYQNTALFLSDYSKRRNSPDLLFNGACRTENYFEASTAGDDMALIADLGTDTSLEKLSAHLAFNKQNVHTANAYSKFASVAKVLVNHTYAVLLNKRELRGLFIFTVTAHVPDERVELRYVVKEYQVLEVRAESPGFSWEQKSSVEAVPTIKTAKSN